MDALTLIPRLIYVEDIDGTLIPTGDTASVVVLGLGQTDLTRVPIKLLTQLVSATSDANAASKGVPIGDVYYLSTTQRLHTRMS